MIHFCILLGGLERLVGARHPRRQRPAACFPSLLLPAQLAPAGDASSPVCIHPYFTAYSITAFSGGCNPTRRKAEQRDCREASTLAAAGSRGRGRLLPLRVAAVVPLPSTRCTPAAAAAGTACMQAAARPGPAPAPPPAACCAGLRAGAAPARAASPLRRGLRRTQSRPPPPGDTLHAASMQRTGWFAASGRWQLAGPGRRNRGAASGGGAPSSNPSCTVSCLPASSPSLYPPLKCSSRRARHSRSSCSWPGSSSPSSAPQMWSAPGGGGRAVAAEAGCSCGGRCVPHCCNPTSDHGHQRGKLQHRVQRASPSSAPVLSS